MHRLIFQSPNNSYLSNSYQKLQMKTSFANRAPVPLPSDQLSCSKTFILFHEKKIKFLFWMNSGFPPPPRICFNNRVFIAFLRAFTWWERETQLCVLVLTKNSILPMVVLFTWVLEKVWILGLFPFPEVSPESLGCNYTHRLSLLRLPPALLNESLASSNFYKWQL